MEDAPSFDRERIGGNHPPSAIDLANEAYNALSAFLAEYPAIADEESARKAKLFLDRSTSSRKDAEDDRAKHADPVYARWKAIREPYAAPIDRLEKLIAELSKRMTKWALAEDARRKAEAAAAAKAAEEARLKAEAALAAEREAIDNAAVGDFEADVGAAVVQADDAIAEARRAELNAKVAERDSHVRIGGGFQRASSLRTTYEYAVDDVHAAITALWPNIDIREAIKKAAREHDRINKAVPEGVSKHEVRKI